MKSRLCMDLLGREYLTSVETHRAGLAVGIEVPQGGRDGAEGDLLPRNLALAEQRDLQGLLPGREIAVEQLRAVEDVNLVDGGDREQREHLAQLDPRLRLLHGL